MPFNEILDHAKRTLVARKAGVGADNVEAMRSRGEIPGDVQVRRSIGVDDDLATGIVLADQFELASLRKRLRSETVDLLSRPEHLVNTWGMCEVLGRLGFDMGSEMAVAWGDVAGQGENVMHVILNSGGVQMKICVCRFAADSKDEALAGWDEFCNALMAAGDDDLAVLLARSTMGNPLRVVALAAELARQGFKIRGVPSTSLTLLAGPAVTLSPGGEG